MYDLLESWLIALESERKSVHTIKSYADGVGQFLAWCEREGQAADLSSPEAARLWLVSLARAGRGGGTMQTRLGALRAFARWLEEEGELPDAGVLRAEWPQADEKAPAALTPAQRDAILAQCDGKDFVAIRDAAMFSLMFDSLLRSDELLSMRTDDIDLRGRRVRVRRGKGGRERFTTFSAPTARRVDRYLRARRKQPYHERAALWLGRGRDGLTYHGLYATLKRRGARAGIKVHPHMLRGGGAVQWRLKGGSTESLKTIAGWRDWNMVLRYTQAAETEIAIAEAQRLFAAELFRSYDARCTIRVMQLWEMTDGELRAELARVPVESNRYDEIMAEMEERSVLRRSASHRRPGWHSATDLCEGS